MIQGTHTCVGYQKLSVSSTATGLTVPSSGASAASVAIKTADVRWLCDGTDPTASNGMPLAKDRDMWFTGDLDRVKFIAQSGTAEVNVAYWQ